MKNVTDLANFLKSVNLNNVEDLDRLKLLRQGFGGDMGFRQVVHHFLLIVLHAANLVFEGVEFFKKVFQNGGRVLFLLQHGVVLELVLGPRDVLLQLPAVVLVVRKHTERILSYLQEAFVQVVGRIEFLGYFLYLSFLLGQLLQQGLILYLDCYFGIFVGLRNLVDPRHLSLEFDFLPLKLLDLFLKNYGIRSQDRFNLLHFFVFLLLLIHPHTQPAEELRMTRSYHAINPYRFIQVHVATVDTFLLRQIWFWNFFHKILLIFYRSVQEWHRIMMKKKQS